MNKEEYEALSPEEQERYKQEVLQKKYGGVAPVVGMPTNNNNTQTSLNFNQGMPPQGQQYAPQMDNFSQSQYGSDAYDLSMQGTPSFTPQPEYGEADYRRMYGNVPNQQYDDGTNLPMTMENAEYEETGRRGRFGKKNKQPSEGGKPKIPSFVIIIVLAVIIVGGGFAAMKMGILPDFFGLNRGSEQPAATEGGSSSSSNSGNSANPANSAFVGTWSLYSLQDGSKSYDKDKIKNVAKDNEGYLLLFEDGTMQMKLIGDGSALEGTWQALSDNEIELNIGGNKKISGTYDNNILKIQYDNQATEFEKTANSATPIDDENSNSNSSSGSLLGNSNTNLNTNTNANANTTSNTSTSTNADQPQTNTSSGTSTGGGDTGGGSATGGGFVDVD